MSQGFLTLGKSEVGDLVVIERRTPAVRQDSDDWTKLEDVSEYFWQVARVIAVDDDDSATHFDVRGDGQPTIFNDIANMHVVTVYSINAKGHARANKIVGEVFSSRKAIEDRIFG